MIKANEPPVVHPVVKRIAISLYYEIDATVPPDATVKYLEQRFGSMFEQTLNMDLDCHNGIVVVQILED